MQHDPTASGRHSAYFEAMRDADEALDDALAAVRAEEEAHASPHPMPPPSGSACSDVTWPSAGACTANWRRGSSDRDTPGNAQLPLPAR